MTAPITITLDGIPVAKGRPRFTRAGHTYTPSKTRAFETDLGYTAKEVMAGRPLLDGPLMVLVVACFPIPKKWSKKRKADALAGLVQHTSRPDWENIGKCLDAFNKVVWRDDSQVVVGMVRKEYSDRPRLVVTVTPIETVSQPETVSHAPQSVWRTRHRVMA